MSDQLPPVLQDETTVTDITIGADGRIFIFGTSLQVLEALASFQPGHVRLEALLGCLRQTGDDTTVPIREDSEGILLDRERERT